jgi:hypothetical protein
MIETDCYGRDRRDDTRRGESGEMRGIHGGEGSGKGGRQALLQNHPRQPDTEGIEGHRREIGTGPRQKKWKGHPAAGRNTRCRMSLFSCT